MSTSSLTWTEGTTQIAGLDLHIVKGGNGDPLLILHDEMGQTAPLHYAEELAQNFTLHMPAHPGFGITERLDWIMTMRDLASWYLRALEELGLERVKVLGFSLGGWLAAEMAWLSPFRQLNRRRGSGPALDGILHVGYEGACYPQGEFQYDGES